MSTGRHTKKVFNNLMAFWPGMQVMMGDFESASSTLNAFHAVRRVHEFTPEDFSFTKWKVLNARGTQRYPLRPELVESTWYMYEATGDRSWLIAGREMFESLSTLKVRCGVASVSSVVKREKKHELEDSMPSFFLAETMKYLILLFGGGRDFLRRIEDRYGGYVFTTEAHIFPISPSVVRLAHKSRWRQGDDTSSSSPSQWFSSSLLSTITSSSSILARNVSSMTCPASWTAFS
jgi:ER degradation enhancer, mannosidase alpha-like 2